MKVMVSALNGGRLSIGAVGLGLAQGAYERAVDYAKKRVQFGKPIVENQAIRFKLAEIAMKIEAARSLLYNACHIKDAGEPYAKEAAMAKLYCSDVAEEAARNLYKSMEHTDFCTKTILSGFIVISACCTSAKELLKL